MITDALLSVIASVGNWLLGWLPDGAPIALPSLAPLWSLAAEVNSLIEINTPVHVMLGVLAAGVVFVVARLVLTLWNLVYP